MGATLLLDVGAGTLDMLWTDGADWFKAVGPSPSRILARVIESTPGNLAVGGREMGGGAVSRALEQRATGGRVVMSIQAAATIHHSPDRVKAKGIEVVTPEQLDATADGPGFTKLRLGDIQPERLEQVFGLWEIPFEFERVGVCLQDHGRPPRGRSHLDFRNSWMVERLESNPHPASLAWRSKDLPEHLSRMRAAAADAALLPAGAVYVMDSGMAAVLGGWREAQRQGASEALVVDVATSHTVAAVMGTDGLVGFFELHTKDLDVEQFDRLVEELVAGRISHSAVVERGGHGAWCRGPAGRIDRWLLVGPKRHLLAGSRHDFEFAAPLGDNMLAGCAGLLEAMDLLEGKEDG
ncbi:MAG: pyruvate formate-lyase activating enzyme [Deltaproteobacteria bacterium]|nr:MAG: pyruvate formate-lyase activating enzyme [Deltaproteobacteria bacterium]